MVNQRFINKVKMAIIGLTLIGSIFVSPSVALGRGSEGLPFGKTER